jgi:DNA-binding protein
LRGRTFPSKSDSFIKKTVRICEALRDDFLEKIALERVALKSKEDSKALPSEGMKTHSIKMPVAYTG